MAKLSFILIITLGLLSAPSFAGPHGGDGQNISGDLSQMASDGSAEGGGGPSTEISDGPSGPAPLAQPTTVANDTVRSVPDRPGTNPNPVRLDHPSTVEPRSPGSMAVYERAYNADLQLVNKWLDSFK